MSINFASSGPVTRAGGQVVEGSTTSTSATDLLSVSGLNIDITSWILFVVQMRKTSGAAAGTGLGIKMNTTVVGEAGVNATLCQSSATDQAEGRAAHAWLAPRTTNYNITGSGMGLSAGIADGSVSVGNGPTVTAAQPIATITDMVIRAITDSALVECSADEFQIFTFSRN